MGYYRAGFRVIGVDKDPQPRFPFEFIQGDVFEVWDKLSHDEVAVYAASPPCQGNTPLRHIHKKEYPQLIKPIRNLFKQTGKPYIIENTKDAKFEGDVLFLCGTMFGLDVIRHRYFENNFNLWIPPRPCRHHKRVVKCGRRPDLLKQFHSLAGHFAGVPEAKIATGIDWMNQDGLRESIPPTYTEWIGKQLMRYLE